ncbi:MAG: hypothetical protein HY017_19545 [Betaproteobacteria bacterium]|nr:hypothetical protein [Betaproteobacteria bacterium]
MARMRLALRILGWTVAAIAVAVLVFIGINLWDEPLSPQAQQLLKAPEFRKPGPDNAWIADIGFHAPLGAEPSEWGNRIVERSRALDQGKAAEFNPYDDPESLRFSGERAWFDLAKQWPLEAAQSKPQVLRQLLDQNLELYRRYQKIRELPEYTETFSATRPMTPLGVPSATNEGSGLALAKVALAAIEGDFRAAVLELERESAYHRRVLTQSETLFPRMFAVAMLARDWAMLCDLVRIHGALLKPFRRWLEDISGPLPATGLDLQAVLRIDGFHQVTVLPGWRREIWGNGSELKAFGDLYGQRPFYRLEALGFRSNATVNAFAEWYDRELRLVAVIYAKPREIEKVFRSGNKPLGSSDWTLVNPTGNRVLALIYHDRGYLDYVARMRDISAFGALIRTQMDLVFDPAAREGADPKFPADGEAREDDLFGTRIYLDRNAGLLWFNPLKPSWWGRAIASRYNGRVAVPLK